jgi:hypothetical protein
MLSIIIKMASLPYRDSCDEGCKQGEVKRAFDLNKINNALFVVVVSQTSGEEKKRTMVITSSLPPPYFY